MTAADHASAVQTVVYPLVDDLEVVRAMAGPDYAAALEIRRRVFGDEQAMVDATVADADDARSLIALALRPRPSPAGTIREPVGTGRLTLGYGTRGEALIAWVATLPEARGRGIATATMRFLLRAADTAMPPATVLAAQCHAEPFYRRFGFVPAGEVYAVRGIAHRWMVRLRP